MAVEIITKEDLQNFGEKLLQDLQELLNKTKPKAENKTWLRSHEVRKLLNISAGTLHTLRVTGKIRFSKVGKLNYYRREDIERMLNDGIKM